MQNHIPLLKLFSALSLLKIGVTTLKKPILPASAVTGIRCWDLGDKALKKRLAPNDPIEWIPFLQAYAQAGDIDAMKDINRIMKKADPFVQQQVCQSIRSMDGLSASVVKSTDEFFCSE